MLICLTNVVNYDTENLYINVFVLTYKASSVRIQVLCPVYFLYVSRNIVSPTLEILFYVHQKQMAICGYLLHNFEIQQTFYMETQSCPCY